MIKSKKYYVMRFTSFNGNIMKVCDLVNGITLQEWVKKENLTRGCIFSVMEEIVIQLNNSSLSINNPSYGAVTPFNVIISDKNEVLLLDKDENGNNKELSGNMSDLTIKRNYVESYEKVCAYNPGVRIKQDIFTYGVILGFIIANTEKELRLSKIERIKFKRFINKCMSSSEDRYVRIKDVLNDLLRLTDDEEKRQRKKTTEVIAITVCLLVILSLFLQVIFYL